MIVDVIFQRTGSHPLQTQITRTRSTITRSTASVLKHLTQLVISSASRFFQTPLTSVEASTTTSRIQTACYIKHCTGENPHAKNMRSRKSQDSTRLLLAVVLICFGVAVDGAAICARVVDKGCGGTLFVFLAHASVCETPRV